MGDREATTATLTVLIEELADKYAKELDKQIKTRMTDMEQDDRSYYLMPSRKLDAIPNVV